MSDKIIQLNEDLIKHDLKDLVRNSVEETLNALLDKEADELVNAEKYERSSDRQGYRSGHYKRNLHTTAGEVELKVPKLKGVPFETAIIERYRRRESSVEEALIEMYLAGVSVRRVEDITEALWGTKVSPGTIRALRLFLVFLLFSPVFPVASPVYLEELLSFLVSPQSFSLSWCPPDFSRALLFFLVFLIPVIRSS